MLAHVESSRRNLGNLGFFEIGVDSEGDLVLGFCD